VAEGYSPNPATKELWVPQAAGVVPGSRWRLETKIGEGGAGEVWSAIHQDLQQRAVFKFCNSEEKARTLKRELTFFRLLKERIGRNSHFIQLEDVSLDEPPYFLRMAYSEARELEVWCKSQPGGLPALDEAVRLEIVAQAAEALQAAHDAGILHRDIKPSNLLVESNDSPAGLHVFVADFGIGQLLTDQLVRGGTLLGFTRTVEDLRTTLAGTMLYLAPEVLEGNEATVRSDIYSIGVLFWQLLVGNLRMALDPSDWASRIQDPLLREDLRRCLAGNPAERWASAGELASRLRALPERRAAAIRRQAELEMRERVAYRNGVLRTATVALVAIVLLGFLAWLAWAKSREAQKERNALAVSNTRNLLEELKAILQLKGGSARALLEKEAPTLVLTDPALKSELRNVASAILALPTFSQVKLPFELSNKASFAEGGERLIMPDTNGCPKVLDLSESPPIVTKLSNGTGTSRLRINAFGLAAGGIGADGILQLWYGPDFSAGVPLNGPIYAGCFALSPSTLSGSRAVAVAVARPDGAIDVELLGKTNAPAHLFRGPSEAVNFPLSCPATMLAFSPTRETILAVAGPTSGMLLFWKISDDLSAPLQGELAGSAWHPDVITSLAWNPSEPEIATGCQDGSLRIWLFTPGNEPQTKPSREAQIGEAIRDIAWSPSGDLIAVLADSGTIRVLWSRMPKQSIPAPMALPGARHIAFAPSGTLVAWGPNVSAAWGNEQLPIFSERRISRNEVYVCFHPDGCLTASATDRVHFLNPNNLTRTASFKASPLDAGYWHGDTFYYQDSSQRKSMQLSRTAGEPFLRMPGGPSPADRIAETWHSPSGNRGACFDRTNLCIMRDGQCEGRFPVAVQSQIVAVSDNSPTAAWREDRSTLQICNLPRANLETETNQDGILDLAFAPRQNVLAVRTGMAVLLIALDTNKRCSNAIPAPAQSFSPVVFSPDGHWLAVCGADDSICLASVSNTIRALASGAEIRENIFTGALHLSSPERRAIVSLCWNAKGDRVAAGSAEGSVSCWNVSLLRRQLRLWKLDRDDELLPEEPRFLPIKLN
jgi:Serine/threonine protein kinase